MRNDIRRIERFEADGNFIHRYISRRDGRESKSSLPFNGENEFDEVWLRSKTPSIPESVNSTLRLADLFCGTGPMSLGVTEAGRALGINIIPIFAIDFEEAAAFNYSLNFPTCSVYNDNITKFINGDLGYAPTLEESNLLNQIGNIDFVIAGPPCQGHSDLNNHTRRSDPRNLLIFRAVRFIELFRPKYFVIENVQGIRHDKSDVLGKSKQFLASLGYNLSDNLLLASKFGVAQKRRRFVLVGSLEPLEVNTSLYEIENARSVTWAINDLRTAYNSNSIFNSSATHSKVNQERIKYLFDHGIYELPNSLRPKCQQSENNRYTSVYGRMYPDMPSPTITSGFGSIGQGRFCHPYEQRSLTPHEAARVQFIPDFFKFDGTLSRVALQKMIGNAVPPKLMYVISLELLR